MNQKSDSVSAPLMLVSSRMSPRASNKLIAAILLASVHLVPFVVETLKWNDRTHIVESKVNALAVGRKELPHKN